MTTDIERLFGSGGVANFNASIWGRRCAHLEGAYDPTKLWSLEQFHEVLKLPELTRHEYVRTSGVLPGARPVEQQHLAKSYYEVVEGFREGLGITVNRLDRVLPRAHPLIALYRDLSKLIGCGRDAMQIACFLTPAGGQNFDWHQDRDHVFTIQIAGEKLWELRGNSGVESCHLRPGDVLYTPYALPHRVMAGSAASLSIAFIARPMTYRDAVIESVMQRLDSSNRDELSRLSPLPLGWLVNSRISQDDDGVERALEHVGLGRQDLVTSIIALAVQILPEIDDPNWTIPIGERAAGNLTLETEVARSTSPCYVWQRGENVIASMMGRPQVRGPIELALAFDYVNATDRVFRIAELPDVYEDNTKVAIGQKLVEAGFLERRDDIGRNGKGAY